MQTHANTPLQVAFIGLGNMGFPMAGHWAQAGYPTQVYNRTSATAAAWVDQYGGQACSTPRAAATGAQIVALCVGNDADVRQVVYGDDGVIQGMDAGSVLLDHTTTSAELAVELAQACAERGIQFMDAPVSGGQIGAEQGLLTVMCGGDATTLTTVAPLLNCYAKHINHIGEHGQGQRCKMVNQICIAGALKGLSEAMTLAQQADLDIDKVVAAVQHGAGGSWQLANRGSSMTRDDFDFGFAIDWMIKDLGLCLTEARRHGLDLAVTNQVHDLYTQLHQQGYGRLDTSALIKAEPAATQPTVPLKA
jgi:3-hydroxyisobutyrate dehydrogenase